MSRGPADYYKDGDYNAICSMCGHKFKASELIEHWQGQKRCQQCWEPRQPQDFVRAMPERPTPEWTQPDADGTYIATCNFVDRFALAGVGVAGCMIAGFLPANYAEYLNPLPPGVEFASTDPVAKITAPLPGAEPVKTDVVTISFESYWWLSEITSGSLKIDGVEVATGTSGSYSWDTSSESLGFHEITYTVTDAVGNTGTDTVDIDLLQGGDPYFSNVVLLMHFDTDFSDSSSYAHTFSTNVGPVALSGVQSVFGSASARFNDSEIDYLIDGALGTQTQVSEYVLDDLFTIEFWMYPTLYPSSYAMMLYSLSSLTFSTNWYVMLKSSGLLHITAGGTTSGSISLDSLVAIPLNTWTSVAITSDGSNVRIFSGGSLNSASYLDPRVNTTPGWVNPVGIGSYTHSGSVSASVSYSGYMDELRITNGACRYTGAYTPATSEFPNY